MASSLPHSTPEASRPASGAEPVLPHAYALVRLGHVPALLGHAATLAAAGAEEGTLMWAGTAGDLPRFGIPASDRDGDLHCALILRPDLPRATTAELGLVAATALGQAIAELVAPVTELHYAWPGRVLLNQGQAAAVALAAAPGATPAWLAVGITARLRPGAEDLHAASLADEGGVEVAPPVLLEALARQLLRGFDRWSGDGLEPVRRAWLSRAWDRHREVTLTEGGREVRGTLVDLDPHGGAVLQTPDRRVVVGLLSGFGLAP